MRKILVFILTILILLLVLNSHIFAKRERRSAKVITVLPNEVVTKDIFIKTGEMVEILGRVNGDVYILGGEVFIDGTVNGDLFVGGGMITISGIVEQDARLAGGQILIKGLIKRNLTAIAGNIKISESARIGGSVLILGGDVLHKGSIAKDTKVHARNFVVGGQIGGNLETEVEALSLKPFASISGNLVYFSKENLVFDKSASISGKIVKMPPKEISLKNLINKKNFEKTITGIRYKAKVLSFLAALVFGFLMIKFFPNFVIEVSKVISKNFFKAMGYGFLSLIFAPLVILVFFVTVIGIPLAIIFTFTFITLLYIAKINVSFWLGNILFRKRARIKSQYFIFSFGLALYYLLTLFPVAGLIVSLTSLLLGLGSSVLVLRTYYLNARKS